MRLNGLVTVTALAMLGAAACDDIRNTPDTAPTVDTMPKRRIDRLFWSGHSLVDRPLPDQFAAIAESLGLPVQWNTQVILGSSIKARSRGTGSWNGYRQGSNRDGSGLDVAAEFLSPRTVKGGPYDALVITEQHTLLGSLAWNDTIGHLKHFHDRAVEGNPYQTTYLYQSWLGIDDRDDPRRWIAYEKAAATAWRCVATRINVSLAGANRQDRIVPIDSGAALATFIEQVAAGQVPGFAGSSRAVVDRLFQDDVHLTPLGSYFVALFVFAELSGKPPTGAWAPAGLTPAEAEAMQVAAWTIHRSLRATPRGQLLNDCRDYIGRPFMGHYLAYLRGKQVREDGRAAAYITWLKHRLIFARTFGRRDARNPLYFDASAGSGQSLSVD